MAVADGGCSDDVSADGSGDVGPCAAESPDRAGSRASSAPEKCEDQEEDVGLKDNALLEMDPEPGEEIIRCVCGIFKDEGLMVTNRPLAPLLGTSFVGLLRALRSVATLRLRGIHRRGEQLSV